MPSERCGSCCKFISSTDGIRCTKCKLPQHRNCVAFPAKGTVSPTWKCPECRKGEVRDNRDDTPVRGKPPSVICEDKCDTSPLNSSSTPTKQREVGLQITKSPEKDFTNKDIIEELRAMRVDFSNFRKEISDLKVDMRICLSRIDELEVRLGALEKRDCEQKEVPGEVNKIINQLRRDLNDRDQDLLANDLEIQNIPEDKGENTTHLAITIAAKLGVKLENRDIVSAERFGGRLINASNPEGPSEPRPRTIVVRLARRDQRDELLQSARDRRTADTSDMGISGKPQRFYVNERLTKSNRQLFRMARDAGRLYRWQFIWTKRGRILARRKPGDTVVRIRVEKDIAENIGQITNVI